MACGAYELFTEFDDRNIKRSCILSRCMSFRFSQFGIVKLAIYLKLLRKRKSLWKMGKTRTSGSQKLALNISGTLRVRPEVMSIGVLRCLQHLECVCTSANRSGILFRALWRCKSFIQPLEMFFLDPLLKHSWNF